MMWSADILTSMSGNLKHNIFRPKNVFSVRNKQLPTCLSRVEFARGKLKVSEYCPLDNMKFHKIILFHVFLKVTTN